MRHAGSGSEGFLGMENNMGINRIEQDAETDQLTVMLFADEWFVVQLYESSFGKKTRQLVLAA